MDKVLIFDLLKMTDRTFIKKQHLQDKARAKKIFTAFVRKGILKVVSRQQNNA
jgi:hypothetical protein